MATLSRAIFDLREVLASAAAIPQISIVDVGAMLGGESNAYAPLVQAGLARVIGFEPNRDECDKAQAAMGSAHRFLPYAVGDGSARTFHVCRDPATSSLYEPNRALLEKFQQLSELLEVVRTEPMQTHRLDDLTEVGDVDYLKLDVQGAELDVIRGAARVLDRVVIVQTEVEFVPLYKDQPLFADVDLALRERGFVLHRILASSSRAMKPLVIGNDLSHGGSQQLWAEALYVKDFMRLEVLAPEKLLKLALILHTIFRSVDLVTSVLMAYDAKSSSKFADAYVDRLTRPRTA